MTEVRGIFSQVDPRWREVPLGMWGGYTLGSAGCLVTAAAGMLADILEMDTDPGRLNRWLCRNEGFVSGNLFVFGSLEAFDLMGVVIDCAYSPAPMAQVMQVLEAGGGVLAKVDMCPGGAVQQHWVRIVEVQGDDVLIHDPWLPPGGGLYWLMPRYGHYSWDDAARAISRLVLYRWDDMDPAVVFDESAKSVRGLAQEGMCVRL